ncbi:MAG: hypothetical protein K9J85_08260 [Desulfobacteraceae bacterium]|nr:hypothetical protein [Desulfobacteraceae bacterium]
MVVFTNAAGLGNRLKFWVSAMRLAADTRVHWKINRHMPPAFPQLFENECSVDSVPHQADTHNSWRLLVLPEEKANLPSGFSTAGAGAHPVIRACGKALWLLRGRPDDRYRYMIFTKTYKRKGTNADARYLDFEYERIQEYFRKIYRPLFRKIIVREEILQRANEWANANLDENIIGVQVRSWRDHPRRQQKYHKPSMKRLSRLIEGCQSNDRFLVVSDSDDVIRGLKKEYGDKRILYFPRETAREESRLLPEGIVEDLVDMLLLARTNRLFASYLSTFSEAA